MKKNFLKPRRLFFPLAAFLLGFSSIETFAQTDNALNFGGTNDYVLVNNPNDFNVGATTNFTIQVKIKTTSAGKCIFSKMSPNSSGTVTGYQLWDINGKLYLEWRLNGGGPPNIQGTTTITRILTRDSRC